MDYGVAMGSAAPGNEKGHGSMSLKHLRSGIYGDNWWPLKMKPPEVDFTYKENEGSYSFNRSNLRPSAAEDGQKMLSFSSSNQQQYGGVRFRSSFTPSQWLELEHQALIYKHFVSNVPVPPNLLLPIRRSLYSNGSFRSCGSNFLGWGPLHLGFSGRSDPEHGRCRRTDGKKWRCSRDAVPDQKYCERHINRGRHRSRKPVEGQSGHVVSGSTGAKVVPPLGSSSSAVVMSSGSASSSSLDAINNQFTVGRSHGVQGVSLISPPAESFKPKDAHMVYEETPQLEFGMVCSDSFLNSSERISCTNNDSEDPFIRFNDKNANSNSVRHFIDNWPKDHQPSEELKSDWTQLSMSISSLGPYHEAHPIQMNLGVSHDKGKDIEKQQPSWLPVSWGNSMGGPLGEVLTTSTAAAAEPDK